jgi:FkbM family methyltransferase
MLIRKILLSLPGKLASSIAGRGLGKIPLVTWVDHLVYRKLKPDGVVLIDVQGSKMYVDSRDIGVAPYLMQWGFYEKYETELFKKSIRKGMVVVDVGANVGYYTLMASRLVGEEGRVFAFEPEPQNYDLLCKNIKANGCRNVVAERNAVWRKSGEETLFLDKSNLGGHSLVKANVMDKDGSVCVKATSLDEYFGTLDCPVDFIKMDVQGSEMGVFEGMEGIMKQDCPLGIMAEFWPEGIRNSGVSPEVFLERLVRRRFDIYSIGQSVKSLDINQPLQKPDGKEVMLFCQRQHEKD